jgi:hypothetical protein
MSRAILKRGLGEGGAFSDTFGGYPGASLYEVLKAALRTGQMLTVRQATIATGVITKMVATQPMVLRDVGVHVEVAGSAGSTVVEIRKNGVAQNTITVANTASDPSTQLVNNLALELAAGDVLDFNVATAPTGGTGLVVTANFAPVDIE